MVTINEYSSMVTIQRRWVGVPPRCSGRDGSHFHRLSRFLADSGGPDAIIAGMERWNDLFAAAKRHNDTITPADVRACDIPLSTFRENARRLGFPQLHPLVWAPPGSADTYERQLTAAQRAVKGAGLLTAESVLWLYGCIQSRPTQTHLLMQPKHHHGPLDRVRFYRGRWVDGDKPERRNGYDIAPLLRSLTDAAPVRSERALTGDVVAMDRLRLASLGEIASYMELRGRFPGNRRLADVLRKLGVETAHSAAEKLGRRALRALGLRPAPRPYAVVEKGIHLAEIDIAFAPLLYGVEVDGPHHLLPEVAQADKIRDRGLEQRHWRIDRFTTDEIERSPAAFALQVRQGVIAAAARLGFPAQDPRWMVTING